MPYPNEHSARVREPGSFNPNSFRSKDLKGGVRIIIGKLKDGDSMIVQAYRFSVDQFTVEEAKKWLEDHKISYLKFEPAQNESETGVSMSDVKNKIEHTGVLGMKWGRRSGSGGGGHSKKKSSTSSAENKVAMLLKKKKVSEMTNDELRTVSTRIQLEQTYKTLNPGKVHTGKKIVAGLLGSVAKSVANQATQYAGQKIFEIALNKATVTAAKVAAARVAKAAGGG